MIDLLLRIFHADDFGLIAVILGMPLLGAIVNGIWGARIGKAGVRAMALAAVGTSFLACLLSFLVLDKVVGTGDAVTHGKLAWTAWEWMSATTFGGATVPIQFRFSIDALSGIMMLVVTGVGFLIHLYATSYMEKDKSFARFFAYLNLFIFSMLVLILGDNLPVLFVGWEGVGLCSYLLIGFWFEGAKNAAAGKKAFLANRIGDFGLILAMALLLYYTGSLDWDGIQAHAGDLITKTTARGGLDTVSIWPVGGGAYGTVGGVNLAFLNKPLAISGATAVGLCLLLGCSGKSAQLPLYVWLPDAMAGPTPVSALIHAATMVTAGVYLVCRMSFVFAMSPFVMMCVALVGATTALLAATIALVQNDIKKVLAYSTVSQLGFMFIGVGAGAFTAGFFHVLTHAFFKACLFLGAGSVIHAMHARIHDDERSQDMRNMGGLKKHLPITYWTFFASTLAIAGAPFLSGFFSKDEILYRAFVNKTVSPQMDKALKSFGVFQQPDWVGPLLYVMGVLAATMTAFYMFRCFFMTFHGDFRGWVIGRASQVSKPEHHADHHHEEDLTTPGRAPHESPWQMTVPLIVLATFAVFAGYLNPGPVGHLLGLGNALDHWLGPVFKDTVEGAGRMIAFRAEHLEPGKITATVGHEAAEWAHHIELPLMAGGIGAFLIGTGIAYWMYVMQKGAPAKELHAKLPWLHKLLLNKWYVDEIYDEVVLSSVDALADTAASADKNFVDVLLARMTALAASFSGTILRAFQTGVVHTYSAIMVLGLAALGVFFWRPHAEATIKQTGADYVLTAAPGMGYKYHWDADGDGKFDKEALSPTDVKTTVTVEEGKSKTVRLEVENAFGERAIRAFVVSRPDAVKTLEVGKN